MTISIIGGTGGMGKLFGTFFKKQGYSVYILGRKTKNIRQKLIASDVIFISVPSSALWYAVDLLKLIDLKGKLVVSLGSSMMHDMGVLKNVKGELAFIHALFGPAVNDFTKQNMVISGNKSQKHLKSIVASFKKGKVNVSHLTPSQHDQKMAYIQALSQASALLVGKTISESGLLAKDMRDLSTVTFRMKKALIDRILTQKPELWAHIQFQNPYFLKALDTHIKNMQDLRGIIEKGDYKKFEKMYQKISEFWTT